MKRHRIAVIGAGNRGTCLTRAARISSADRFDVVAVVDPDDNAVDTYGRVFELNGVDRFPDCGRMREAGLGLDGAFIANPPHVHADAACALLEAGVPIYLEKPMASDIGGALRIMEAADLLFSVTGIVGLVASIRLRSSDNNQKFAKIVLNQSAGSSGCSKSAMIVT